MNSLPFPQLQAFLAVTRHRSFSGAARELGVTRSAVSQAVRQLEEQLHVVLLTRTTRSVALTELGRRLVEGAAPGIGQIVSALNEVGARPGETVGRVSLSVPRAALCPFGGASSATTMIWSPHLPRRAWDSPTPSSR
ncbi:MAG TPA: LysR family transcriptional regulator [Polyangiaceae bacterium]|nr:LysR family transcriptional regulator [Polyangiaceae bacterium]